MVAPLGQPGSSRPRHLRRAAATLAGLAALGACSPAASGNEAATTATPVAAADGLGLRVALVPTTEGTEPAETPATTDRPSSTHSTPSAPSTTAAPTTTAAATTTVAPTTTVPLPPANRVPVAPTPTPLVGVGQASGDETARIQQRLIELGFWVGQTGGRYDLTTSQAVMAFQKYLGLDATGSVDDITAGFLSGLTLRAYGHADSGTLLEVDKARQILLFVVDGRTQWVFNTSTGNGERYIEEDQNSPGTLVEGISLTPDGLHEVNRERPEGWWEGDLGQIYRPKYFVGGVAVHGSNSVPNYPASHGCVRVTVQAMDFIWESGLMPLGLPVWVHQQPRPA